MITSRMYRKFITAISSGNADAGRIAQTTAISGYRDGARIEEARHG